MSSFIPAVISSPPGNTALQLQNFKLRTQLIVASSGTNPPSASLKSNSLLSLRITVYLEKKLGVLKVMGGEINNKHEQTVKETFTVVSCMSEKREEEKKES